MAASNEENNTEDRETLADANRRKLDWLEDQFQEQVEELESTVSDLEAENTKLRRRVAELEDGGQI